MIDCWLIDARVCVCVCVYKTLRVSWYLRSLCNFKTFLERSLLYEFYVQRPEQNDQRKTYHYMKPLYSKGQMFGCCSVWKLLKKYSRNTCLDYLQRSHFHSRNSSHGSLTKLLQPTSLNSRFSSWVLYGVNIFLELKFFSVFNLHNYCNQMTFLS